MTTINVPLHFTPSLRFLRSSSLLLHSMATMILSLPSSLPAVCRRKSHLKAFPVRVTSQRPVISCLRAEAVSSVSFPSAPLQCLKTSAGYTRDKSCILLIGLSYNTAPVEMREKLAVPEAECANAIEELCGLNHVVEAAVLSTCNRVEVYVVALSRDRALFEVTEWMAKKSGTDVSDLKPHLFVLRESDATQHLFRVSAGLDSLVLGEGQVLSQVKQVATIGNGAKGFGKIMTLLFNRAIQVGKEVRTKTNISSGAVSISASAVELALSKLPVTTFRSVRVLVVGAGQTGKLVIKHLAAKGCKHIVVVNRSEQKVAAIHKELKGVELIYKPSTEMLACAAEADVVFTCTSSEKPLFLKEQVETLPSVSEALGGLRLFVDISVPRNVGSCVSDVGSARLYDVDDLKEAMEANMEKRRRKAMEAEPIIAENLLQFEDAFNSFETVPTLKKLRSYAETIRAEELERCLSKLGADLPEKLIPEVTALSHRIVKKLLQGPIQHLKCSASEHRTLEETVENMHVINRMYSLDTQEFHVRAE